MKPISHDGIWVLSEMYRLQPMATYESVYGLQERIEKLEAKRIVASTLPTVE